MSIITYNGITLPYPMYSDFHQEDVYDEDDTDRMYTKFVVTVQCYLSPDFVQMLDVQNLGSSPTTGEIMSALRYRLLQHRKKLSVLHNGAELIPRVVGNRGDVDAKNGPLPQHCNIIDLSEGSFLLSYQIVAHYWENTVVTNQVDPRTGQRVNNVQGNSSAAVYNRWTETVDIDQCMYSKRTRTGKYIIRSDNRGGVTADELRDRLAVLGIPSGFVRENSKYTITPDGLGLEYSITDKEVYMMPPEPAFEATGRYTETTVTNGASRDGEMYVKLRGARETDRAKLIETAVVMCSKKLASRGSKFAINIPKLGTITGTLLLHMRVTVDLFDNVVECHMKMKLQPGIAKAGDKNRKAGVWGLDFASLSGETPGIRSPDDPPEYRARGNIPLLLQAAAYHDPNLFAVLAEQRELYGDNPETSSGPNSTNQMDEGKLVGEVGREGE